MSEARKTVKDCEDLLKSMGKRGSFRVWTPGEQPYPKKGGFFFIDSSYGQLKVMYESRIGGSLDISPRLRTGLLYKWVLKFGTKGFKNVLKYSRRE